jgi:hypothetical protein
VRASISACGFAVKSSARNRRCPTVRALPSCNMQHTTFGTRHATHDTRHAIGAEPPSLPQWLGWLAQCLWAHSMARPVCGGSLHGLSLFRRNSAIEQQLPRLWSSAVAPVAVDSAAQTLWADRIDRIDRIDSRARRAFCSLPSLYPIAPSRRIADAEPTSEYCRTIGHPIRSTVPHARRAVR